MAFPQNIKDQAYNEAGGKCEKCSKACRRIISNGVYCYPDSEFHHILSAQAGGSDGLANCQHLCTDCHKKTKSYGGY